MNLVGVSNTSHTAHYTKDVVVNGIYTDLGSVGARYCVGRKDKLKDSVVNSGEVACARGLVFLRAKSEGVYVDTSGRGCGCGVGKVGQHRSMIPHAQRNGLGR